MKLEGLGLKLEPPRGAGRAVRARHQDRGAAARTGAAAEERGGAWGRTATEPGSGAEPRVQKMLLGRVVGNVVATQKSPKFEGAKLLLVQPVTENDAPRGPVLLAVDGVGAGVNDTVLLVVEGRAAAQVLGRKLAPVDAAIVGIVDRVDVESDRPTQAR